MSEIKQEMQTVRKFVKSWGIDGHRLERSLVLTEKNYNKLLDLRDVIFSSEDFVAAINKEISVQELYMQAVREILKEDFKIN